MHLKTFTARTASEAMQQVREALGDDAIILATQDGEDGIVHITAALDGEPIRPAPPAAAALATVAPDEALDDMPPPRMVAASARQSRVIAAPEPPPAPLPVAPPTLYEVDGPPPMANPHGRAAVIDQLYFAFRSNSVPAPIADYLLALADGGAADNPHSLLHEVIEREFRFASLVSGPPPARPIALIGPPGVGKTQTAAKLAAGAAMRHRRVALVSTDTRRTGGTARLAAFAEALKVPLHRVGDGRALETVLDQVDDELLIIDSEGCNPLDERDRQALGELVYGRAIEPVLVLADGMDPAEASDTGLAFAGLGASRLIITRTDTTRRHGTPLAAASGAGLAFADYARGPLIRDGLLPLEPHALASLLLSPDCHSAIRFKNGT